MSDFGYQKLWGWFGLSRASWLITPRVLMHQMPDEWQGKMADLLEEMEETFPDWSEDDLYVSARRNGKFKKLDPALCNYRYPAHQRIADMARGTVREGLLAHVARIRDLSRSTLLRKSERA